MSRKVLGLIAAVVLAVFGTVALAAYVNGAEDRALEGQELLEVYLVQETIPAGFPADDLAERVSLEQIPAKAVPDGVVADLEELAGLVAGVDLVPGEHILRTRFDLPDVFARDQDRSVEVPLGLQEITLSLEPFRAVGGAVLPGDTVGVFVSFDPFDLGGVVDIDNGLAVTFDELIFGKEDPAVDAEEEGSEPRDLTTPNTTHLTLYNVLVTNVQLEQLPETVEEDEDAAGFVKQTTLAPTGNLLVTLALDASEAERLVFGSEFGRIWLSSQSADTDPSGTRVQTRGTIYFDNADEN